jgi:TetR/AcrR family transcriptional repressor of nem operon
LQYDFLASDFEFNIFKISKNQLTSSENGLTYQPVGMVKHSSTNAVSETRHKLIEAGMNLMRAQGYNATAVDEICAAAGVTKGGFFHYFKSKEELAQAALEYFVEAKARDYEAAPFRKLVDPRERVFGRLDFVKAASGGDQHPTKGCLIGVFAQEMSFASAEFRNACQGYFSRIAADYEKDLAAAKAAYAPDSSFEPKHAAWLYVATVQGSLMLAKTAGNNSVLAGNLEEFRRYLQSALGTPQRLLPAQPVSGNRAVLR